MEKVRVHIGGGAPICATEITAIFARVLNPNKQSRRNKSCRKRDRKNRWK
ncbi:TMhelix containing protein [Vibrio phage 1.090.B._10N.286.48.F1]|nr:TMhelix containing protein [Vibrio phage 1.090.B._10N.286.48.F1]